MVLLPLWWDVTSVTGLALARDSMMTVLEGRLWCHWKVLIAGVVLKDVPWL